MERRLGHDFSRVRVHAGREPAAAARRLQAAAFTVGEDVVWGADRFTSQAGDAESVLLHELKHVVEQRTGVRPREMARQLAHVLGDPQVSVLEALDRHDGREFLNRLHGLTELQRVFLAGDADFMRRVHAVMRGLAFWTVRLILRYGSEPQPLMVRKLYSAVSDRRVADILDLLRSFPALRDETVAPGVVDMLHEELYGTANHGPILSVATGRVTATAGHSGRFDEAHIDVPKGGGKPGLMKFGSRTKFMLARTASEVRVIVRIRFVQSGKPAQTFSLPEAKRIGWRYAIDRAWNGRFTVFNGTARLNVVFVPMFVTDSSELPDFEVEIDTSKDYVRADVTHWWLNQEDKVAAHEFGHMVGNPDEYGLPAHASDIPVATVPDPGQRRRSSVEGLGPGVKTRASAAGGTEAVGLMGANDDGSRAEARHAWTVLSQINSGLRAPGENAFRLEVH